MKIFLMPSSTQIKMSILTKIPSYIYYKLQRYTINVCSIIVLISFNIFANNSYASPTASFSAMFNPFSSKIVLLDAISSIPNTFIKTYSWWASNGQISSGIRTNIRFEYDGLYTIALQITDNDGLTNTSWNTMGNWKTGCGLNNATYFVETQELLIPYVALYDPFHHHDGENIIVASTILQQFNGEFKFRFKQDSIVFVEEIVEIGNSCTAIYVETNRTLHIPFIEAISSDNISLGIYQATFKHDGLLTLNKLVKYVK